MQVTISKKTFYNKIYKILEDVTPLKVDCGGLCNGACCEASEEVTGMYLFPGEEVMYDLLPGWADICESSFTYDNGIKAKLITCEGICDRSLRPLSCRIFPLVPYAKRGEKLKVVMDIRAKGICPLAKAMKIEDLDPLFVKRVTEAMNMCMKIKSVREFLFSLSQSIDDVKNIFKLNS